MSDSLLIASAILIKTSLITLSDLTIFKFYDNMGKLKY